MPSPYMNSNGGVSFMPPPGLAAMLQQRNEQMQKDADNIGNFAGQLGGGIVGAFQGAKDPGVFGGGGGDGTEAGGGGASGDAGGGPSAASGAFKGFLQNFAAAGNGGGGGGGTSAFSNMVQGGGGATGGMNVKQLQLAGKTADAFRDQMSAHTSSVGDDDPKVLGMTDDEWDTQGAAQKWAKVQGYVQGQAQQSVMQKIADVAAQARERDAQAKAMGDTGTFLKNYVTAPASSTGAPPTPMERFANAATNMPANWDVGRSLPMVMTSLQKFAALGDNGNQAFASDKTTAPGFNLVTRAGSKEWQALPSGAPPTAIDVTDEEGNPTGTQVVRTPNGKGWMQVKPQSPGPGAGPTTSKDGKFYFDTHFNSWKPIHRGAEDALEDLMHPAGSGGGAATPPATPGGIPKPTTQKELDALPKGSLYINPADGKTYRKK